MKYTAILIALVLATLSTTGCGKRKAGKPRMGEVERLPRLETVVLGKPSRLEVIRSYTATIEALEKTDLSAMVKGALKIVPADLDIGRVVKKDELLLSMYIPELVAERNNKKALLEQNENEEARAAQAVEVASAEVKEAQAQLQRYEAEWEFRKSQYTRVSRLVQGDTLSQQQAEESKLQLNASMAAFTASQALIATKQSRLLASHKERQVAISKVKVAQSELERAEVPIALANLRAPFDGVITKRWVDSGTLVKDASQPLLTLMRTDKVRVILDIPERDVPYFRTGAQGSPVELVVPALQEIAGVEKIRGTMTLMASALDPVTRTMRAEMHLDNKLGDKVGLLKPQMTGTANVTLAERNALTAPSSALMRVGDHMELYIVADPSGDPPRGVVKRVEVQPGIDDGHRIEIRNEVLTGRELVIVKGAGILRPGDQVIGVPARQVP